MALKIQLRKDQKIIINGAVIENASPRSVSLLVINDALILRDSDILSPEEAATPAARAYYALQCLYLFPGEEAENLPRFNEFLDSYERAAPSAKPITEAMRGLVEEGKFYQALKKGRELIGHEHKVFADVQEKLSRELRQAPGSGESPGDGGVGSDSGGASDEGRESER